MAAVPRFFWNSNIHARVCIDTCGVANRQNYPLKLEQLEHGFVGVECQSIAEVGIAVKSVRNGV